MATVAKVRPASPNVRRKLVKSIEGEMHHIYRQAREYYWPHTEIMKRMNVLYETLYPRIRMCDKEYLYGVSSTLFRLHWDNLVFSYVVNGKRLAIDSPEYRAVEAQFISEFCSDSGAHMYRGSNGALFNEPGMKEKTDAT